jgi:putative transposase
VLLRLAWLAVTNMFALPRLLPASDRDKDVEILALRHQITVLERQLGKAWPRFSLADQAFLAALLHRLPRDVLGRFRLLVRPETVLRSPGSAGPPPRSQITPKEPGSAAHRALHPGAGAAPGPGEPVLGLPARLRELLVLGIKVAASTAWEILRHAGIDPATDRASATCGVPQFGHRS